MEKIWIYSFALLFFCSCHKSPVADGKKIEEQILNDNALGKDFDYQNLLDSVITGINSADTAFIGKRIVWPDNFHSGDTSQIMLISYRPNGESYKSYAYSDIKNRYILINPDGIREFILSNTLNDSTAFRPVLELMLLHEIGHFIQNKPGAFDDLKGESAKKNDLSDTQPEYITSLKKIELDADSLAIEIVKKNVYSKNQMAMDVALNVERVLPGIQFQLSGKRMIENFGSNTGDFLHDPSATHPNLELRITFMNYFLFRNPDLKQLINNYIYNRTVAPVHRQETDPRIFQGQEKKLQF